MKKIPTLFERQYANHRVVGIKPNLTEGMEWVLDGEGIATVKKLSRLSVLLKVSKNG